MQIYLLMAMGLRKLSLNEQKCLPTHFIFHQLIGNQQFKVDFGIPSSEYWSGIFADKG